MSGELVLDTTRPPARVLATQLADLCLELGSDLVGTRLGSVGAIGERRQTSSPVAGDPVVDALPSYHSWRATSVTFQPSWTTAMTA